MDQSDLEFIEQFESCRLPKEAWTHRAHLRMAWIQLRQSPTFSEALDRIRDGIRKFNAFVGSIGYHETVTVAFTHLIHSRILTMASDHAWPDFIRSNGDLLDPILHQHYSDERLRSETSKAVFVEPDRKPLPAPGRIRQAREADAKQMLSIYTPYVESSAVSFEITTPTEVEFKRRVAEITSFAPWLVFEMEGKVGGYAYASKHRQREAYQWTVEVSVYVSKGLRRRQVARMLYSRLFTELRARGFYLALAGVALPNEASVRFHEAMGFEPVGIYRNVGFKLGRWHDVGWWQREIQPPSLKPTPIPKGSTR